MVISGADSETVQRYGTLSAISPSNICKSGRYVPVIAS